MSKKIIEIKPESLPVKVFVFTKDAGAYGFNVVEIPSEVVEQHAKLIEKIEPDIFQVCENQLIKKAREVFGF